MPWQFGANVYVWAAGISGTTSGDDHFTLSFNDIINNLDFTAMVGGEARKGKWSIIADIIYMDLSDKTNMTGNVLEPPVITEAKVKVSMTSWVVNMVGGYNFIDMDKLKLDLVAGARYLYIEPELSVSLNNQSHNFSDSGDVLDPVVGLRGRTDLTDKWFLSYYVDWGTGDSESTAQALGGFGYHFKSLDAFAGYRYIQWNLDNGPGQPLAYLDISGPYAGVRFRF